MLYSELEQTLHLTHMPILRCADMPRNTGTYLHELLNIEIEKGSQAVGDMPIFKLQVQIMNQIETKTYNPSAVVNCYACGKR